MTLRLAVLISGRGSNMRAIHQAVLDRKLDAAIALILSDKAEAAGLEYARSHGLNAEVVLKNSAETRTEYDQRLIQALENSRPQLIALAGFMRILSPAFIRHFEHRIVNIHPSLLPAFPGLHAQRQAIEAGVRFSGCTVHFVDEGCDSGPIIDQRAVPVKPEDDEATLSQRILQEEHRLYPACLQLFAENRIRLVGRKVRMV